MMHSFVFGGINSVDFNVFISGGGTFSAPERSVELVSVPGRNGDLIIDGGKWNNIAVTYPAFIPDHFERNIEAFRAAISRLTGYQRLEDTYHPDEYRMAMLSAGIDPAVRQLNRSGSFNLVLNCKPQRFLKAGENVLLSLSPDQVSQFVVAQGLAKDIFSSEFKNHESLDWDADYTVLNLSSIAPTRDVIIKLWYDDSILGTDHKVGNCSADPTQSWGGGAYTIHFWKETYYEYEIRTVLSGYHAYFPTPIRWEVWNGDTLADAAFPSSGVLFNPTGYDTKPLIHLTLSEAVDNKPVALINDQPIRIVSPADNILPNTGGTRMTDVYIDCDTQNAYMPEGDTFINLNPYVVLPNEPIELGAGESDVFANGYIDSIEITPRWWRL